MSEFKFPAFHSFPPSYTRQPVESTRAKQTQLWCDLIRDYCAAHKIFWLDVAAAKKTQLFRNDAIARQLSDADILYFLGQLVVRGDGEWDKDHKRCLVYWRRPSEWGELIFSWVEATGQNGQLLTIHEIRKGSSSRKEEFHGLELDTFMRALQALESAGKCAIMEGEVNDGLVSLTSI